MQGDTTNTTDTTVSPDSSLSTDNPDTSKSIDSSKTPPLPETASFGDNNSPTIYNSSLFTYQSITPKADGQTGALTQDIQIDIPPGRSGVQPDLKLQYNSQRTEDSIVGYGWTISIPYIQRLNKNGSQYLYSPSAYFTSSIDGELATTSSATTTMTFVAKVDDGGQFNAYSFSATTSTWTMYDKNGTRYTFGASDQSQQNETASSTTIYKWMLNEIRDTNDNYVRFVYAKDNDQIYPYQIIYTGSGSTDGPFTVSFATSTRSDVDISYKPGFGVTTKWRINKITVAASGSTVREYNLSYTNGNNGVRSLLSAIQEDGYDINNTKISLPSLSLGYINSSTQFYAPNGGTEVGNAYVVADSQGDGQNDSNVFYLDGSSGNHQRNNY